MKRIFVILSAIAMTFILCVPTYAFPVDGTGTYSYPNCDNCNNATIKLIYVDEDGLVKCISHTPSDPSYTPVVKYNPQNSGLSSIVVYSNNMFIKNGTYCHHVLNSDGTYSSIIDSQLKEYVSTEYTSLGSSFWESHVIASSHDITSSDGSFFLPATPIPNSYSLTVAQVAGQGLTELPTGVGGTMKVLTLCGVGLMALLVVLSLFGKRSLIFRG